MSTLEQVVSRYVHTRTGGKLSNNRLCFEELKYLKNGGLIPVTLLSASMLTPKSVSAPWLKEFNNGVF